MTLDEAKAYLRIDSDGEDALLARLVASAAALCEAFTGQLLVRRLLTEQFVATGAWQRLGATPVTAIVAVERIAATGDAAALAAEAYAIDLDPAGDGWVRAGGGGTVRVTYRAGLADDAAGVPEGLAQGVTRLVAHLYAHRDDSIGPPTAVAALWRPFRRLRLGAGYGASHRP